MSAITPLLDTLLHQVLGRAGDTARLAYRQGAGAGVHPTPTIPTHRASRLDDPSDTLGNTSRRAMPSHAGEIDNEDTAGRAGRASRADEAPEGSRLHRSRTLATLMRQFGAGPFEASKPSVITSRTQIIAVAKGFDTANMPALADRLAQQLTQSGVFYEAHLLRWVRGEYDMLAMARESAARILLARRDASAEADGERAGDGLARLVPTQLDVLATDSWLWQGLAWHGAPLQWSLRRLPEHADEPTHDATDAEPVYETRLALDLSRLGRVEARLCLSAGEVSIQAVGARAETNQELRAACDQLTHRLSDRVPRTVHVEIVGTPS